MEAFSSVTFDLSLICETVSFLNQLCIVPGKVWKPPEERETTETAEDDEEIPLSMDLKTDYDDLLDGAEEDDLKDIGAILGLNFFPELTKATK